MYSFLPSILLPGEKKLLLQIIFHLGKFISLPFADCKKIWLETIRSESFFGKIKSFQGKKILVQTIGLRFLDKDVPTHGFKGVSSYSPFLRCQMVSATKLSLRLQKFVNQ